ncbi:Na+/H+ antiporter NhaC [Kordiimonas pumila]|uniref:Na+/H+ antiporter NhaC n=1 Tax=Kordiimonas pumila TaxID=2161677 RepID=A0ABV7D4X2_9PROT|nr:Na+/H+ antiporter NhaC [Kordiimonas pumila]
MANDQLGSPPLWLALIPVFALTGLLSLAVFYFGENASSGANQIALITATGITLLLAWWRKYKWAELEKAIAGAVSVTVSAILILLTVGALMGSWILSGTVPTMIYYGLKLISPDVFYVTVCLVCSVTSLSIGSSWSTVGTIGLGLMGVSASMGMAPEITAGAIISGAYFGDKMSPLSDTTNLAPAVAGTDLFTHIKHMVWTTAPAYIIALGLYTFLGIGLSTGINALELENQQLLLAETFGVSPVLLLPMALVFILAYRKVPAWPALLISTLTGCVFAIIFQYDAIVADGGLKAIWAVLISGYVAHTPNDVLNGLLSAGGMQSIMNTVWLIITAMTFGAVMEKLGFLEVIVRAILGAAHKPATLILATACTCIGTNIVASEQYISVVMPGRMFRTEYERSGLAPQNLSRVLEDSGTVTSALVPWNTCGAFLSGVLGVYTLSYLPYCFFNLLCPVFTVVYGFANFTIVRQQPIKANL